MAWPADDITTGTLVTADMLNQYAGEWETWVPTLTNITLGNGTVTARFFRVGRYVAFDFNFILGSTSAMGTDPKFSLPVPIQTAAYTTNVSTIAQVSILDAGTKQFSGVGRYIATDTCLPVAQGAAATYVGEEGISATVPMTWTTSDRLMAHGWYESAT